MDLILPFLVKKPTRQIHIKDKILFAGSCFAEEIGDKMTERRLNVHVNPHGILYNPYSLAEAIVDYTEGKTYTKEDIFLYNEVWQSFKHHGRFSHKDPGSYLEVINGEILKARQHLKECTWLCVTFGSAFVYKHKKTDQYVGNCHKVPAHEFDKLLLTKDEIVSRWTKEIGLLRKFNPKLNIIFTVSPVRYVRDGLIENNRSKGILLDAVHSLLEKNTSCFYFPAYEIVIDQLRDHRFYKEDLVHPNELAVNYVWEKFADSFCDERTQNYLHEFEPLLKGMKHKPFHEDSEAHEKFKKQLEEKIKALDEKYL